MIPFTVPLANLEVAFPFFAVSHADAAHAFCAAEGPVKAPWLVSSSFLGACWASADAETHQEGGSGADGGEGASIPRQESGGGGLTTIQSPGHSPAGESQAPPGGTCGFGGSLAGEVSLLNASLFGKTAHLGINPFFKTPQETPLGE